MPADRHGLPLSTASAPARDAYVQGVDALLAARATARGLLQRALDADPDFALARIALARALALEGDAAGARAAAARARGQVADATRRERGHVEALALAIEGRPDLALAVTRLHLQRHGPDAMVLAPATGVFGLIGFSGRASREHELHDWLQELAPLFGDDWWFGTVLAFAECETGRLDAALDRVGRSLSACPGNAHAAHVMAHVRYERGDAQGTARFLADWLPGYERSGTMHCHLSWHAALSALALGRHDEAWAIYRASVHPGAAWGPPLNVATDAASFLWLAELAGQGRAVEPWTEVHRHVLERFPTVGVTFADVHVALACAAVGDDAGLRRLDEQLQQRLRAGRLPAGEGIVTLVQGVAAFARGDPGIALAAWETALPELVRIGGSRAQRDLFARLVLAALLSLGRADEAGRWLGGRARPPPLAFEPR